MTRSVDEPIAPSVTSGWVSLRKSDFANGTYRIRSSGRYRLAEDIEFRPNPANDFRPTTAQSALYPTTGAEASYRLGFFAAITIEAADVILDLNGKSLSQHKEHALQQRFFANIELADQPFIPGQGPADFGASLDAARRVIIRNGTIGLSSHHGIHGNDNMDVRIHNVRFVDFEVAAISLNGPRRLRIDHCDIVRSRQDVPVLGTYSGARFLRPVLDTVDASASITLRGQTFTRDQIISRLDAALSDVFNGRRTSATVVFQNPSGDTDGPAYGILINKRGVAINNFCSDLRGPDYARNVTITNVRVNNIKATPREVMTISKRNGERKPQVGTFGEKFQIASVSRTVSGKKVYQGDVFSDAQMLLAKHTSATTIDTALVSWAESGSSGDLAATMSANGMSYLPGGDTMFHVNKGVMGIRCDGVSGLVLTNVSITNVVNRGALGSTLAGRYFGSARGHPNQNDDIGYGGAQVRGLVLARCFRPYMQNLNICNIISHYGSAWGVDLMNGNNWLRVHGAHIFDVKAATRDTRKTVTIPNTGCAATGLDLHETRTFNVQRIYVRRLLGKSVSYVNSPVRKVTTSKAKSFSMGYNHRTGASWYKTSR